MRSVPEWIGKDDNTPPPPRVKVRIFDGQGKACACCGRSIVGRLRPQFDHKTALINGGENRETNLQCLCHECHGAKTKQDVAIKSRVYRSKVKRVARKPRTITGWRKFDGTKVFASRER